MAAISPSEAASGHDRALPGSLNRPGALVPGMHDAVTLVQLGRLGAAVSPELDELERQTASAPDERAQFKRGRGEVSKRYRVTRRPANMALHAPIV
jgi:hypothetical protein